MSEVHASTLQSLVTFALLVRAVMSLGPMMHELRYARMRRYAVPDKATDQLREFVLAFSLVCWGLIGIQLWKQDVPILLLIMLPASIFITCVLVLAAMLLPRARFKPKYLDKIVAAPFYSALLPMSDPLLKIGLSTITSSIPTLTP